MTTLNPLTLYPIKTRLIQEEDDLVDVLWEHVTSHGLDFRDGDVLVVASKVVALVEGRAVELNKVRVTNPLARWLARQTKLAPEFVQLVLEESDEVLGWLPHVIVTKRGGVMQANAGVDNSNAGKGRCVLLPLNPSKSAWKIYHGIKERWNRRVGIIISDSKVHPLRKGTMGFALAVAGFKPIASDLGKPDLYGRPMRITTRALADNLASAAQVLMGESGERIPFVLVRGADVELIDEEKDLSNDLLIDSSECLYFSNALTVNPKTRALLEKMKESEVDVE